MEKNIVGRNKNLRRKRYVAGILLAAVIVFGAFIIPARFHAREEAVKKVKERQLAEEEAGSLGGIAGSGTGILELDGKNYRRNTAIRAILCIGVDTSGEMEQHTASGQAGQADGLFLVAQDMARDRVRILMIPRDTMTEITLFDLMGNELGKDVQHLTLAFAYGDGREKSCELLVEAVSDLCSGLRLDGYLAMNTSSIPMLNDEVGGVTVTIRDEGMEARDSELFNGNTVRLNGSQAEIFIRYRDVTKPHTALSRMSRQKQYMQAYLEAVRSRAEEDDELITRLVDDVENHMITNMAKDQYMDMGLAVLNSQQSLSEADFLTVPGQASGTSYFDEYNPDLDELKRIVVELFYKEM